MFFLTKKYIGSSNEYQESEGKQCKPHMQPFKPELFADASDHKRHPDVRGQAKKLDHAAVLRRNLQKEIKYFLRRFLRWRSSFSGVKTFEFHFVLTKITGFCESLGLCRYSLSRYTIV